MSRAARVPKALPQVVLGEEGGEQEEARGPTPVPEKALLVLRK